MRVLITGYEPAYGIKKTPSGEIARMYQEGSIFITGVDTFGLVLPQSFDRQGELLRSEMSVVRPDYLVMLGSMMKPGKIRAEEFALNIIHTNSGDNSGIPILDRRISQRGPAGLETNANIGAVISKSIDPRKFTQSFYAGTHVCNALYYEALEFVQRSMPMTITVFLHVPFPVEFGVMDDTESPHHFAEISQGVKEFIQSLIQTHSKRP